MAAVPTAGDPNEPVSGLRPGREPVSALRLPRAVWGERPGEAASRTVEHIAGDAQRAPARRDVRRLIGEELRRIDTLNLERGRLARALAHVHPDGLPPCFGH